MATDDDEAGDLPGRTARCGGCGRAVDWRTDLHLNPAWLRDPDTEPVLCTRCLAIAAPPPTGGD